MKAIKIFIIIGVLLIPVNYVTAQDIEPRGGLLIVISSAPTETVRAVAGLLVIDPQGRKAGLDISSGVILQGIPNASYGKERIDDLETGEPGFETGMFDSITPVDGLYKAKIIGTASGKYLLEIIAYDITFGKNFQDIIGTTYPGKIDNYEITYSSAPGSQVKATFVGSSTIPVFDGKGQRPMDVDKFLQYFNPIQASTELPAGTQSFNLIIIYGNTIKRETFSATLNGTDISKQFDPLLGKLEIVKIPLTQGTNTLVLSVKGVRTDGKISEDTDRLTFIVP